MSKKLINLPWKKKCGVAPRERAPRGVKRCWFKKHTRRKETPVFWVCSFAKGKKNFVFGGFHNESSPFVLKLEAPIERPAHSFNTNVRFSVMPPSDSFPRYCNHLQWAKSFSWFSYFSSTTFSNTSCFNKSISAVSAILQFGDISISKKLFFITSNQNESIVYILALFTNVICLCTWFIV